MTVSTGGHHSFLQGSWDCSFSKVNSNFKSWNFKSVSRDLMTFCCIKIERTFHFHSKFPSWESVQEKLFSSLSTLFLSFKRKCISSINFSRMSTVATFHKTFFKNTPLFIFSRSFKHIYISLNFWHIWDFPFISVVDSSSALSSFPAVCLIASAVSISSIGVEATVCTISLCYILGDSSSQLFLHSSSFFYV